MLPNVNCVNAPSNTMQVDLHLLIQMYGKSGSNPECTFLL